MKRRVVRVLNLRIGGVGTLLGLVVLAGVMASGMGCAVTSGTSSSTSNPLCTSLPHQSVTPATAVADHAAAAPGNQQQFTFPLTALPTGCAQAQFMLLPTWVSSDPVNAPISNTPGATFGVATCVGATTVPVTISTTQEGAASVGMLTCK